MTCKEDFKCGAGTQLMTIAGYCPVGGCTAKLCCEEKEKAAKNSYECKGKAEATCKTVMSADKGCAFKKKKGGCYCLDATKGCVAPKKEGSSFIGTLLAIVFCVLLFMFVVAYCTRPGFKAFVDAIWACFCQQGESQKSEGFEPMA
jgi:hypothetical protein